MSPIQSLRQKKKNLTNRLRAAENGEKRGTLTIGTHALIHGKGGFENGLGLVIIDEQHKFGVAQRQALIDQGDSPDVLVMTATPIPRTLTLSFYGDLDVSILDELPPGRGKIITGIRLTNQTDKAAARLIIGIADALLSVEVVERAQALAALLLADRGTGLQAGVAVQLTVVTDLHAYGALL